MTNSVGGLRFSKHVLSVHTNYNMTCEYQTEKRSTFFQDFILGTVKCGSTLGRCVSGTNVMTGNYFGAYELLLQFISLFLSQRKSQNRKQSMQSHHSKIWGKKIRLLMAKLQCNHKAAHLIKALNC